MRTKADMPTLHKFKLLATQCAVAGSPSRTSPTTSPVIHLRRRKTLRMLLLSRPSSSSDHHRRRFHPPPPQDPPDNPARVRHKLRDLFVSSPPPPPPPPPLQNEEHQQRRQIHEQDGILPGSSVGVRFRAGSPCRRGGSAALRPVSSAFRYRLLRRIWRPVLVTIPE